MKGFIIDCIESSPLFYEYTISWEDHTLEKNVYLLPQKLLIGTVIEKSINIFLEGSVTTLKIGTEYEKVLK